MNFSPNEIGKFLIGVGLLIAAIGGIFVILGGFGLFKLPGDIEIGGKNWKFYFPIASCIVISAVLTLISWIMNYFRK